MLAYETLLDTLRAQGGFTANGLGYRYIERRGFAVSVAGFENRVKLDLLESEPSSFEAIFRAYASRLRGSEYVGAWLESDGYVTFDITRILPDAESAYAFAREQGQRAIFDFETEQVIAWNADTEKWEVA